MSDRRPRRTAMQLESDIHAAVIEALLEEGYREVTFEGVARRCEVSKPVLYRRYADRSAMVLDAIGAALRSGAASALLPELVPAAETLRHALVARFESARERAELIGAATYRGLVGEADLSALQEIAGLGADAAHALLDEVVRPAQQRGELGPVDIPTPILLAPLRVLRDQTIFGHPTIDTATLVDDIALPLYRRASGAESQG